MKWSAFTDAVEYLQATAKAFDKAAARLPADRQKLKHSAFEINMIAETLKNSQKFYLPGDLNLIAGKEYTTLIPLMRLPFKTIALLSEIPINNVTGQVLTIAFELPEDQKQTVNDWVIIYSLIKPPGHDWDVCAAGIKLAKSEDRIEMYAMETPMSLHISQAWKQFGQDPLTSFNEAKTDVDRLSNLCVMLALKNVRPQIDEPPPKLNKKRAASGKLPLYAYHVLEVDGEVWGPHSKGDGSAEYRSHLRRGHIRRLSDGRAVWVRATYVHGRMPGFVSKDYAVKEPTV